MKSRPGRNLTLIRALSILRLLQTRDGVTLGELSRDFDASGRTIRRDIEALCSAGFPVTDVHVQGERGGHAKVAFTLLLRGEVSRERMEARLDCEDGPGGYGPA